MDVVHLFNHPVVAALLLTLAFLGLAVEVRSEGLQRAGWAGLLALSLFALSHVLEGTPLWTLVPLVAGVAVLWPALEDPHRRWSAVLGVGLTAVGAFTVLVGPGPAHLDVGRALMVMATAAFLVLIVAAAIWSRLPAQLRPARRAGVFFHVSDDDEPGEDADLGPGIFAGEPALALTALEPHGWILLRGERVEAVVDGEWVEEGETVEVVDAEGVHPVVRPASTSTPSRS